jgi:hypothetical protein
MERTEIDIIRQMPIAVFLARLGHEPVRRSGNELWYIAPYRGERTPSFRVNVAKQLWYDFGLGKGGDIFTLAGEPSALTSDTSFGGTHPLKKRLRISYPPATFGKPTAKYRLPRTQ